MRASDVAKGSVVGVAGAVAMLRTTEVASYGEDIRHQDILALNRAPGSATASTRTSKMRASLLFFSNPTSANDNLGAWTQGYADGQRETWSEHLSDRGGRVGEDYLAGWLAGAETR